MIRIVLITLVATGLLAGCQRSDVNLSPDVLEFAARSSVRFPTNVPCRIVELSSNDVIVAVNGFPLTKAAYDDMMILKAKGLLNRKGANQLAVEQRMDQYRRAYVKQFVAQRLLCDAAYAQGVVTTNEVLGVVRQKILAAAKRVGKTPDRYLSGLGMARSYFLYELAVAYVMDKLIHEKIPPAAEVNEEFVNAVKKQVAENNAASQATNALIKTRMQDYRKQLADGSKDFRTIAARIALQDPSVSESGVWGDFEEDEMDDPAIAAKVFALPLGGISDVLEDDNGYHLVKVLEITPPETNEAGRVIQREKRKLSQIYVEKLPMLMEESDLVLTADLKSQMQMQSVNIYVTDLSTNGLNRIEYPHGDKLFD